jgi:hypothetical protein
MLQLERDGIECWRMKRMTLGDATQSEPTSAKDPVMLDGERGVFRAGWLKAACSGASADGVERW